MAATEPLFCLKLAMRPNLDDRMEMVPKTWKILQSSVQQLINTDGMVVTKPIGGKINIATSYNLSSLIFTNYHFILYGPTQIYRS